MLSSRLFNIQNIYLYSPFGKFPVNPVFHSKISWLLTVMGYEKVPFFSSKSYKSYESRVESWRRISMTFTHIEWTASLGYFKCVEKIISEMSHVSIQSTRIFEKSTTVYLFDRNNLFISFIDCRSIFNFKIYLSNWKHIFKIEIETFWKLTKNCFTGFLGTALK